MGGCGGGGVGVECPAAAAAAAAVAAVVVLSIAPESVEKPATLAKQASDTKVGSDIAQG